MVEIRKISFIKVFSLFFFTSALVTLGIYQCIPLLLKNGFSFFVSYIFSFYTPFLVIFLIALVLYKVEGNNFTIENVSSRFRLQKITKSNLFVIIVLFVACFGTYALFSFTSKLLASVPLLAPPDYFPVEINPLKERSGFTTFMDFPMKGNWWMPVLYFIGWFFNIFGEELLWRGYLLPRMEKTWGKYAWLLNGSLWSLWHVFWKWNLLIIAPSAFLIPFVAQKTKNTWIGIIVHGTMNFIPLILLILGVLGILK